MKKLLALLLALVTTLALVSCGAGGSSTKKGTEGLEYEAYSGSYVVTGYTGSEVNIVIPDTYNDVPVVAVEKEAFFSSDIQSVAFGVNMQSIGYYAFGECSLLKNMTFTESKVDLSSLAFAGCLSLETITFQKGSAIGNVSDRAFMNCSALKGVSLSENTTSIGEQAFFNCTGIAELTIPANVSSVGAQAFCGMTSNQKLIIEGSTDAWTSYGMMVGSTYVDASWNAKCDAEVTFKQ